MQVEKMNVVRTYAWFWIIRFSVSVKSGLGCAFYLFKCRKKLKKKEF